MRLNYNYGNKPKEIYVLKLGERNGKLVCLLDEAVDNTEAVVIRKNLRLLESFSITSMITWLKTNTPNAYKKGYREIYTDRFDIMEQQSIPFD